MTDAPNPRICDYPRYSCVRDLLRIADGQSFRLLVSMRETLWEYRGTPQETRNWSNADEWIPQLLSGEERTLAHRLWTESEGRLNPRFVRDVRRLSLFYELFETDVQGTLHVTGRGRNFLEMPLGDVVQEIDYKEGLLQLLTIVAESGPGKRADLLPHFEKFLLKYSAYRAQSTLGTVWRYRMTNLEERELVTRSGVTCQISQQGLRYLDRATILLQRK